MLPALAVSAGISALGGLFGGGSSSTPTPVAQDKQLMNLLRSEAARDMTTGFLPDEGAYNASMKAEVDSIMSRLPAGITDFNADLASRGVFGSGEAPKRMYADVFAPLAREATLATTRGRREYQGLKVQGMSAAEQLRQGKINSLMSYIQSREANETSLLRGEDGGGGFGDSLMGLGGDIAGLWAANQFGPKPPPTTRSGGWS